MKSAISTASKRSGTGLVLTVLVLVALFLGAVVLPIRRERARDAPVLARSSVPGSKSVGPELVAARSLTAQPAIQSQIIGRVQSSSGIDLPGASVCALRSTEACCTASECVASDLRGRFVLTDVEWPTTIVASAPGYLPLERLIASATGPSQLLRLTLGGSELSGSVIDAAGGPVPFANVTVRGLESSSRSVALADSQGQFRASVSPGPQEIVARGEGFSCALDRVVAPATGIVLELGPSSEIAGTVLLSETTRPLQQVTVTAERVLNPWDVNGLSREPRSSATTDASGAFRMGGLRGGGTYRVQLDDARWGSDPLSVALDVGASSAALVVTARPATSLMGRVFSAAGVCTQGEVQLAGLRWSRAPIDENGSVRFQSVQPGHYSVDVYCEHSLPYHEEIDVGAEPMARDWKVQPGLSVSGSVVDSGGQPFPGAKISVASSGDPSADTPVVVCSSAADGLFSCGGLRPGEYDCSVVEPVDGTAEVRHVVLQNDSAPGVVLHLRPMGSVHVHLRASAEASVSGGHVFARSPTALPIQAKRVENGFVFEHLPLGRYQVYVDQPVRDVASAELSYAGQVYTLELTAPQASLISGFAVDESGAPLLDTWIKASASDPLTGSAGLTAPQVLTDESGAFALMAVRGGIYDLRAQNGSGEGERLGVAAGSKDVILRVTRTAGSLDGEQRIAQPE
jgi:hypothetical protein